VARRIFSPADARRLLNPGPVGIVTTNWRGMDNAAPIAWMTTLSMDPALVGLAIHSERHTADMIQASEEFAINIPGRAMMKQTAFLGSVSGADSTKLEEAELETFKALRVGAPLIEGCLAWIECGLQDVQQIGDHLLFVAEVVKVQALDEAYSERWLLEDSKFSPLIFLGKTHYTILGQTMDAVVEVDELGRLVVETPEEREQREEEEALARERVDTEGAEGAAERTEFERDSTPETPPESDVAVL
jgi:flavin reductase (DIM6/NTAB) family NADH-FMN oxidoreductase RutF